MAGRRIDDHKAWMGGPSKGSVFPEGAKVQTHSSDGHSGDLSHYEDTDTTIKHAQEINHRKQKGHDKKEYMRY